MSNYTYRTIIEPDGDAYHGYVPALPGCHTYGKTLEETRVHLREAIEVYLLSVQEEGVDVPEDVGFESFETVTLNESV